MTSGSLYRTHAFLLNHGKTNLLFVLSTEYRCVDNPQCRAASIWIGVWLLLTCRQVTHSRRLSAPPHRLRRSLCDLITCLQLCVRCNLRAE